MSRRVLVVCTANVCRSPMAAGFLDQHLRSAGHGVLVRSAGTRVVDLPVDPVATQSMREFGIDISNHTPRRLDHDILDSDGADLILTMTREHLRTVVASHRQTFGRAFTLREFLRRNSQFGLASVGWDEWIASLATGRTAGGLMGENEADDIADPYGLGRAKVRATANDLNALTDHLTNSVPW